MISTNQRGAATWTRPRRRHNLNVSFSQLSQAATSACPHTVQRSTARAHRCCRLVTSSISLGYRPLDLLHESGGSRLSCSYARTRSHTSQLLELMTVHPTRTSCGPHEHDIPPALLASSGCLEHPARQHTPSLTALGPHDPRCSRSVWQDALHHPFNLWKARCRRLLRRKQHRRASMSGRW